MKLQLQIIQDVIKIVMEKKESTAIKITRYK